MSAKRGFKVLTTRAEGRMGMFGEVQGFLDDHDLCGGLAVDSCPPTSPFGYYFALACCCRGFLDRWVTPEEALRALVWSPQLYVGN